MTRKHSRHAQDTGHMPEQEFSDMVDGLLSGLGEFDRETNERSRCAADNRQGAASDSSSSPSSKRR